jgi:hypothetical protein
MKRRLWMLFVSAAVVSTAGASAQAPADARRINGAVPAAATRSTPPVSTTLRVPGTIDQYDASTRVLSLSTSDGKVQFSLAAGARIRRGGQTIDASELAKLSGRRAVVRYWESGDTKTVESVRISGT